MRVNASRILLFEEIQTVLAHLQQRSEDSINAWTNLITRLLIDKAACRFAVLRLSA